MKKKTMILADSDRIYLQRLSNYFMEKSPQLELNIFTDEMLLEQYLAGNKADILVVDENFAGGKSAARAMAAVKIVLTTTMLPIEGFEIVKKYQKTEMLLNEILLKYAEATGSVDAIKGTSHTHTAAFYSPAGGTGKTTLALGMAAACVKAGLRTLYLNLEEIDSVKDALVKTPGTLSDIFLALKTKGMNVGIKMASCVGQEASAGFYYLSGVESISEYEEISGGDMVLFLENVKNQEEYDVMILDLSSGFSKKTAATLGQADVIFVPVKSDESSVAKMNRFLQEAELHDMYTPLFKKISLIVNQSNPSGVGIVLQESGLLNRLPCDAVITNSPIFMKKSDILKSGNRLLQMYQLMIGHLMDSNSEN